MVWIRIFRTRIEAERAQEVLKKLGVETSISEDNFEGVPIQKYGVPARFRLNVRKEDFERVTKILKGEVDKRKTRD
ncbi:MAG TPA: hypothetical protein VG965_05725 [Patescibacteria group bacterium]|nr:hypothetical protein [Patescibacteria group bacterium]